jgi:hypothetical protein
MIVLLFNILNTTSLNQPQLLTNSINKHPSYVNILKTNYDYSTVYSVDRSGIMKIWNFNITNLQLRQSINISGNVSWYMSDALFVWNNGAKLFIGSMNQLVKIYTLNSTNQSYI